MLEHNHIQWLYNVFNPSLTISLSVWPEELGRKGLFRFQSNFSEVSSFSSIFSNGLFMYSIILGTHLGRTFIGSHSVLNIVEDLLIVDEEADCCFWIQNSNGDCCKCHPIIFHIKFINSFMELLKILNLPWNIWYLSVMPS